MKKDRSPFTVTPMLLLGLETFLTISIREVGLGVDIVGIVEHSVIVSVYCWIRLTLHVCI
jgi:hypothetical protein